MVVVVVLVTLVTIAPRAWRHSHNAYGIQGWVTRGPRHCAINHRGIFLHQLHELSSVSPAAPDFHYTSSPLLTAFTSPNATMGNAQSATNQVDAAVTKGSKKAEKARPSSFGVVVDEIWGASLCPCVVWVVA